MNDTQHPTSHEHEGEVTIEEAKTVRVEAPQQSLATPIAIVIGFALVAAAIYFGPQGGKARGGSLFGGASPSPSPQDTNGTVPSGPVNVTAGDLPPLGSPKAPVLVVEWGDYQCPFCGRLFAQVEPQLKKEYVETGKARFAFRDFAFLGQESVDAAMAARCANEQGKFWEYHDKLFSSQQGENEGAFSRDNLKKFARELKLDTAAFNSCLDSEKYLDAVTADTNAGRDAGVSGTPTTFINGRMVNGAQPYDSFKKIIEEELQK
jgi:protein-disulfide isomerase